MDTRLPLVATDPQFDRRNIVKAALATFTLASGIALLLGTMDAFTWSFLPVCLLVNRFYGYKNRPQKEGKFYISPLNDKIYTEREHGLFLTYFLLTNFVIFFGVLFFIAEAPWAVKREFPLFIGLYLALQYLNCMGYYYIKDIPLGFWRAHKATYYASDFNKPSLSRSSYFSSTASSSHWSTSASYTGVIGNIYTRKDY